MQIASIHQTNSQAPKPAKGPISQRATLSRATPAGQCATIHGFEATNPSMDNFSVVYAVCKAALAGDAKDGKHQVARLKAALVKTGADDDAQMLDRLVTEMGKPITRDSAPFQQSRLQAKLDLPGEPLTSAKHVPVDRESSAPLAEVVAVSRLPSELPALPSSLQGAVQTVVNEWTHAATLERMGLSPARTCIIYGPPGTGKTQLALWLSGQLGLPVILAKLDGLMSSYLGTTSRNIGNLFQFANKHRALLLLDEFDSIAKLRDDPNEIGEIKRVVNTLLQELDRRRPIGLTMAITNHAQLLDPAVWRRFELQLEMPMPDLTQRIRILERYLPPLELAPGQMQLLSWTLEGCSGSEIEDVSRALKKSTVLEPELSFVERLQRVAAAHGDRLSQPVRALLVGDRELLAQELMTVLSMSQSRVAEALDVNRSTVSRWNREEDTTKKAGDGDKTDSVRSEPEGAKETSRS